MNLFCWLIVDEPFGRHPGAVKMNLTLYYPNPPDRVHTFLPQLPSSKSRANDKPVTLNYERRKDVDK